MTRLFYAITTIAGLVSVTAGVATPSAPGGSSSHARYVAFASPKAGAAGAPTPKPSADSSAAGDKGASPNPAASKSPAPAASTIPGPTFVHVHINAVQFDGAKLVVDRNTTPTVFNPDDILSLLGPGAGAAQQAAKAVAPAGVQGGNSAEQTEIEADLSFLEAQRDQALSDLRFGVDEYQRAILVGSRPVPAEGPYDDLAKSYETSAGRLAAITAQVGRLFAFGGAAAQCRSPLPDARFGLAPITAPVGTTPFETALSCLNQELRANADIDAAKLTSFKARLASLYASIGVRGSSQDAASTDPDVIALLNREGDWATHLTSLAKMARNGSTPSGASDFRRLFDRTEHVICGPAATTYAVYFRASDLAAETPNSAYESAKTLVQCGSALSFSLGAGFSTVPNRIPAIIASKPDATPAPGASPSSTNRFGYLPSDSKSALAGWYGLNTRIRESTDDSAYYLSLSVKPNFKDFEAFIGPSVLLNKSIFITPGIHIAPQQTLVGGWNIGDPVPSSITNVPSTSAYIARFGIMLSFPVTSLGKPAAAKSPNPAPSPSSSPGSQTSGVKKP